MEDDTLWGSDVPISMPVPSDHDVLVDMGTFGFTSYGIAHNLKLADLEDFLPSFAPPERGYG